MSTRKSPTTAETRKAFRIAVDGIGLSPDDRKMALELFKEALWSPPPNKRTRRQEQNQAIADVQAMAEMMPELVKEAIHVIKRNDYDSGQRQHEKDELAADPKKPWQEDMTGSSAPYSGDPTGEEACWDEKTDRTGIAVRDLCQTLAECLVSAKNIHDLSNTDVRIRASRSIPDCLACGDPCLDGVRSGFDNKCRMRWDRLGRPDRYQFIAMVKAEKTPQVEDVCHTDD